MWTISGESYTCDVINHLLLSIQLFVCLCIIVMFFHCFLIVRVKANFCSTFYRNSVRAHRPTFVNTGDTEKKNSRNMPSRLTMDIVELNCLRPLSSISEGVFVVALNIFCIQQYILRAPINHTFSTVDLLRKSVEISINREEKPLPGSGNHWRSILNNIIGSLYFQNNGSIS